MSHDERKLLVGRLSGARGWLRYAEMELENASREAGISLRRRLTLTVVFLSVWLTASVVFLGFGIGSHWSGHEIHGVLAFGFCALFAVIRILEHVDVHRNSPEWLEHAEKQLPIAVKMHDDALAALEWFEAEQERIRKLPSALEMLRTFITASGRDWTADNIDARLFAIIAGLDGDAPATADDWAALGEKHGWNPDVTAQLRDAHEAFLHSAKQENRRSLR